MSQETRIPYGRLSSFYLLYFGVLGAFVPYWALYLTGQGYQPEQIGLMLSIPAFTKILTPALWGRIADRQDRLLQLIRLASFLSLLGFMLMLWPWGITGLAAAMFFYTAFQNGIIPLLDTLTLNHLDSDSHRYARVRIWGSIGFIATVILVGEMLENHFPVEGLPYLVVLLLGCVWIVSLAVPESRSPHHEGVTHTLAGIVKRADVMAFFLACILLQFSHGPYYVFFSVYLEDYGYTKREIGGLWSLGVLAEIILFVFMPAILARFSLKQIFVSSLILGGLRWCLLGWQIESKLCILMIQCLHAASFGSAHVASVHLVQQYFRGKHHGTGQALYSSFSFGLGGMLGSLMAGYLWVPVGPQWVYTLAGVASFVGALIACRGLKGAKHSQNSQDESPA